MIGAADMPSRFLGEAPPEIRDVLDWFNVGQARGFLPAHLRSSQRNSWVQCMTMGRSSPNNAGFRPSDTCARAAAPHQEP